MGCTLAVTPDLLADEGWAEAMAGCAGFAHVPPTSLLPFFITRKPRGE